MRSGMTFHADERLTLAEQVVLDRAVRIVADGAVLRDRRMLESERPYLIRMALEA